MKKFTETRADHSHVTGEWYCKMAQAINSKRYEIRVVRFEIDQSYRRKVNLGMLTSFISELIECGVKLFKRILNEYRLNKDSCT